jgi:hypothetical protein
MHAQEHAKGNETWNNISAVVGYWAQQARFPWRQPRPLVSSGKFGSA